MIDKKNATDVLLKLLSVEGNSGHEGPTAEVIRNLLRDIGISDSQIRVDSSHERIEGFTQGNLIVDIPGNPDRKRILFSAHMDRVPVCRGAVPVLEGNRIWGKGETGVGADNRTGVAALLVLASELKTRKIDSSPITLLFTVGEETGLHGAREVSFEDLKNPVMGFNVDGGDPARIVIGAIGANRITITINGRSAHAGMHPEDGVSAAVIAGQAIKDLSDSGWHGVVDRPEGRGKSNIGSLHGGEATNQVLDELIVKAELRSHDKQFLEQMNQAWNDAFTRAAERTQNADGVSGSISYEKKQDYKPFTIPEDSRVVQTAIQALKNQNLTPECVVIDGGLDANPLNERGLLTVTLGAGQHGAHTVDEYVDLEEFFTGCQILLRIAGLEED